jgi:hypothetical protein
MKRGREGEKCKKGAKNQGKGGFAHCRRGKNSIFGPNINL